MAEKAISKIEVAEITPEIIANEALGMLEAELYLAKNVARDSEFTDATEGETIKIAKRGTLTANQKTAKNNVTIQEPSFDKVSVSLDNHWEVTFRVEDIARTLASGKIEIDLGYITDAIQVLGEKIENALAAKYTEFSAHVIGNGTTDITDDFLLTARGNMTKARAPRTDRFLYADPDQLNAILKLDKFVSTDKYGSATPVQEGEFGRIYNMRVFESLFPQTSGTSPVITHNIAMHRNALVLATRPLKKPMSKNVEVGYAEKDGIMFRVVMSYNANLLADQITIDTLWGVAGLRPEFGNDIRTK